MLRSDVAGGSVGGAGDAGDDADAADAVPAPGRSGNTRSYSNTSSNTSSNIRTTFDTTHTAINADAAVLENLAGGGGSGAGGGGGSSSDRSTGDSYETDKNADETDEAWDEEERKLNRYIRNRLRYGHYGDSGRYRALAGMSRGMVLAVSCSIIVITIILTVYGAVITIIHEAKRGFT
mmetsp:Transcript_27681/g.48896  ORF Transcript_27681/g.48896 Transcript_27681/m.48896 type:complete len:178 (-) Transcript_27681:209-742(-)